MCLPPHTVPSVGDDAFVGRESTLSTLTHAWQGAADAARLVLVRGEARVGKSRLVAQFLAHGPASGTRVLTGHCLRLSGDPLPLAPVMQALRQLARQLDPGEELAAITGRLLSGSAPSRVALLDEVRALFGRLAAQARLVLVFEDLHWVDRATLDLISFLCPDPGSRGPHRAHRASGAGIRGARRAGADRRPAAQRHRRCDHPGAVQPG